MGLLCELNFKETNFRATGLKKSFKRKTSMYFIEKKLIVIEMTSMFCLGQCAIIKTINIEPISLEIFLILFTVRLREDILDPVDPKYERCPLTGG